MSVADAVQRLDGAGVGQMYSQFEAAILRIAVSGKAEISESVDAMNAILFSFRAQGLAAPRRPQ